MKVWPSFIKCGIDDVSAFFTVLTNDQKFLLPCYSQELYAATFVHVETVDALIWRCIYFLSAYVAVHFRELDLISTQ